MQTARLYYDDCYTSLFKAEIVELSPDGRRVYLDSTFFYPASGGQPHDLGSIEGRSVVEVQDEGERIAHLLGDEAHPELPLGSVVECRLDWARRFDHMQQHTGQHLLSAVLVELLGLKTLSFHMGDEVSSIEIAAGKLEDAQIEVVERRANELIAESRPVRISYEDSETTSELRKLSTRTGLLRIVTIEATDRSACGGTHVRTTAEIGPLQIRGSERVRGNVRLEFVCGLRALRCSGQDLRILSKLAKSASMPMEDLPEHVAGLRARLEVAEKELTKARLRQAQTEAVQLHAATAPSPDGIRRVSVVASEVTETVRAQAIAFAALAQAVFIAVPQSLPGTILLACSADSGFHAGALWKAAFAEGGGRGGGSATLAQGSVTEAAAVERLAAAVGVER